MSAATAVSGRLLSYPFQSQLGSVKRDRATNPTKLVSWFEYWEMNLTKFEAEYQQLSESDKSDFLSLQSCYENIVQRSFVGKTGAEKQVSATPMNDAFNAMQHCIRAICRGHGNGLMVVGQGGTGKSYTTLETLASENKREGRDFIRIPGYQTALALYNTLYEHNGKILVFDDCDVS